MNHQSLKVRQSKAHLIESASQNSIEQIF